MAARAPLIATLVFSAVLAGDCAGSRSLLSTRTRSISKVVRGSTSDTIRALDTDGNGRVSLSEIEAFAQKNGIAVEEIRADFRDLDKNQDGELDSEEIGDLFPASPGSDAVADAKATTSATGVGVDAVGGPVAAISEAAPAKLIDASQISVSSEGETVSLESVERDAQRRAGGILAEGLARRAEELLQAGAKDEKSAVSFEAQVRSLRGRSAAASRSIALQAKQAAKAAATAAAKEGLAKAQTMKHQVEELEKGAAKHRSKATVALQQALQAQDGLSSASSQLLKA